MDQIQKKNFLLLTLALSILLVSAKWILSYYYFEEDIILSFNLISPSWSFSIPLANFNKVVLPQPDGPNRETTSPSFSFIEKSLRI